MIPLSAGQIVTVEDSSGTDWWMAENTSGEKGWVPCAYVQMQ